MCWWLSVCRQSSRVKWGNSTPYFWCLTTNILLLEQIPIYLTHNSIERVGTSYRHQFIHKKRSWCFSLNFYKKKLTSKNGAIPPPIQIYTWKTYTQNELYEFEEKTSKKWRHTVILGSTFWFVSLRISHSWWGNSTPLGGWIFPPGKTNPLKFQKEQKVRILTPIAKSDQQDNCRQQNCQILEQWSTYMK